MNETVYDHVSGEDYCTATATECWSKNMFKRLKEKYPEDISIVHQNSDGSMVVRFPFSWLPRIRPRKRRVISNEQRKILVDRMAFARTKKANK